MKKSEQLFKRIQAYHEDDFSKQIVIPLLTRMGYTFTDFNGGPYEQGKDIIAHRLDDFGDIEVTVAQSKMLKTKRTADSSRIFGDIIHQLRMCKSQKIPCNDGIERTPAKVLLITPFDIDTRHLKEQIEVINVTPITIIDQSRLLSLFNLHWPDVFNYFEDEIDRSTRIDESELKNSELHKALHIETKTNYSEYYSDLNFFVGETDSSRVFSGEIEIIKSYDGPYDSEEWREIRKIDDLIKNLVGTGIILSDINKIEQDYDKQLKKHNSKENLSLVEKKTIKLSEIENLQKKISEALTESIKSIEAAITTAALKTKKPSESIDALKNLATELSQINL